MAKLRMNIQLEEIMKQYCLEKSEELGISMSGFISVVLAQYKQQQESIKAMGNIELILNKIEEIDSKSEKQ